MEYIFLIFICLLFLIVLWFILELNIKKLKQIGEDKQLDSLTKDFPENIDVCKSILKRLGNDKVNIKEDKESKTSLYVIVTNTITIANIRDSYTRIQTVAHECIHSVQSKKMLWFNFVYTNIYMAYFLIVSILTLFNIIKNPQIFLYILIVMGMVQYFIRSMLETEAMTKARYVAKEYLEENNICSKENVNKIVSRYDELNNIGIKLVNLDMFAKNILNVIVYSVICIL
ncbi:MAG: hypothetical protein HFJ58_03730 [Clostridia bacterium]|nr:hypothetical protein [Clostridia bacterium]